MKKFNFLSNLCDSGWIGRVTTLNLTVGSPSAHRWNWMQKLCIVLTILLTLGAGKAWGTTWTSSTEAITEKDGITITMSNTAKGKYYQIFKNSSMVVEVSSGNITSISITCTASGTTKYGPGGISEGNGYSYSGNVGTWSGSASSVTLTASTNQVRITEITVETSAGTVPAITISPTSVALGTVDIGDNNTGTFTVTGSNLKGNITLSGASAPMSLSSTTITKDEAEAVGGKTITVTFTPTETASINQTVTASSTDAANKTVTLTGQGRQKYAVHYFVNSVEQVGLKEMVISGETVSGLPDEEDITSCDVDGHPYFVGWSTSNFGTRNTAPTTLVDGTEPITEETYYYAVFAAGTGGSVSTMSIDFESNTGSYPGWSWSNFTSNQSGSITARGGSKYGTTNGKETGYVKTTSKIASPTSLTVYVSKQTNNTKSSTWYIKVSSDGSTWTNVATKSATGMSAGTWQEFTADLSSYSNVYVELYYSGSTAVRNMDDLVLTSGTPPSYTEWITTCADCNENPTVGVAALKGTFSASGVGVTCPTTGTNAGSSCSWQDYGFIWSTSKNAVGTLVLNSDGTAPSGVTKVSVGSSGNTNTFDGTIVPSPFNAGTYYYRAYGKNNYASGSYQYSSSVSSFVARSVTFDLNGHGSSAPSTQIVNNGSKATDPSYSESVTGWRFDGWYANSSCTGSAWDFSTNTVSGDNVTLYAKWTQVYTVTYNYNGGSGSCVAGGPYAEGETVTTCAAPTRSGYTFKGWSDGVTTYNAGSTISNVQNDIVLTAQWTAITYTITYNGVKNGATNTNPTSYTVEDLPINLVAATHEQWRFDGWTDDNAGDADITTIPAGTTGNQSFTAHWTKRYAVTWYEESTPTVTYFDPGTTLQFPADPSAPASCSEKKFVGWMEGTITGETDDKPTFITAGEVNADAAYHAVWATQYEESGTKTLFSDQLLVTGTAAVSTPRDGWSSISYAYGYNGNGIRLSSGSNGASMTVDLSGKELGSTLTITFDAAKYSSENGSLSLSCLDDGANPTFTPASFTISNASWEEKSCTITNVDGKVASITLTGTKDKRFYMKNFKVTTSGMVTKYKEYSTSCCDNNVAAPSVTATATRNSITLSWANVTDATGYKVTINGGTHDVTTAACTYTESGLTSGTDYAWTVIATYNPANYCGAIPTKNTTTTLSVYGVTYNKNTTIGSGTVTMSPMPSDASTYVVGENVTAAAKPATCTNSGYTFKGWNTKPDGTGTHVDAGGTIAMVEGGLTLYAEWVAKRAYYVDRMHGQGDQTIEIGGKTYHCYYGDGYHITPSPSDQKSGDACQAPHYRFVRWLTIGHINADGTQKDTGGAVSGGVQRGTVTDGETYYAIWEEEIE